MEDLKDCYLYKIIARNANYGIWRSETEGFTISRIRFNDNFTFEEHHYDCPAWATAQPIEEIEKSPFNLKELSGERIEMEIDGGKYFRIPNEKAILAYLNEFEKEYEEERKKNRVSKEQLERSREGARQAYRDAGMEVPKPLRKKK